MIATVVALLLPVMAAWWVLRALRLRPATDSRLTTAAIASCLGIGLSSVTTFLAVSLGMFPSQVFVAADAILWLAVAGLAWRVGRHQVTRSPSPSRARRQR